MLMPGNFKFIININFRSTDGSCHTVNILEPYISPDKSCFGELVEFVENNLARAIFDEYLTGTCANADCGVIRAQVEIEGYTATIKPISIAINGNATPTFERKIHRPIIYQPKYLVSTLHSSDGVRLDASTSCIDVDMATYASRCSKDMAITNFKELTALEHARYEHNAFDVIGKDERIEVAFGTWS